MSSSTNRTFERREVEDYEKRRYRGLDQKLVDGREKRILRRIFRCLKDEADPGGGREKQLLILDAPCGYGRFSGLLLDEGARLVSGDLSFHMVGRAMERKRSARHMGGVVADLKRGLPFRPDSFDYVFSLRFFHHLHEPEDRLKVLREFARVTRNGVILSYYRLNGFHAFQRKVRRLFKKTRRRIKMVPGDMFESEAAATGMIMHKVFPLFRGVHAQQIVLLKKALSSGRAKIGCGDLLSMTGRRN